MLIAALGLTDIPPCAREQDYGLSAGINVDPALAGDTHWA